MVRIHIYKKFPYKCIYPNIHATSAVEASSKGQTLNHVFSPRDAAQRGWEDMGLAARVEVLARWRDAVNAAQPALIEAVSRDTGRHGESVREAANIAKWIDRWSAAAPAALTPETKPTSNPDFHSTSCFSAIPIVGVISPWNFLMSLSLMDAIPAMLAGCAVIIKPSEVTPRFIAPLEETIAQVPELDGILTYIRGAGEVGSALVDTADGIVFTGSTATGRKVAAQAAARLIPFFVELGGKDAAIVLEGTDLDRAAPALITGATLGTGQQCYSIERLYVARSLHDDLLARLVEKAQKLNLALPEPGDGQIGPLIHAPQADIIAGHIADAVAKGATVHTGGEIEHHGGGTWIAPTVLSGVTHDMQIMREESFGPLLPVMAFDTEEEAIALANDTKYGLSGAVFGPPDRAMAVAKRMRAGGINVNDAGATPFFIGDPTVCNKEAFGESGLGGSRSGKDSIKRFVVQKMIVENVTRGRSAWWYDV
ncbi:MAG: aldehyde dehydrogenase family protein [Pikeienuella sp.]